MRMKMDMDSNQEETTDVHDWKRVSLIFAKKFVSDIIGCESFQTCDRELKQRINHLFFILKSVEKENHHQQHLLSLLLDYRTFLEEIESGSISLTTDSHFKAWQSQVQERFHDDKLFVLNRIDMDSNSPHIEENLETEDVEEVDEWKKESDFVRIAITKRKFIKKEKTPENDSTSQKTHHCHLCNFGTIVRKRFEKHLFDKHNLNKSCEKCDISFDNFALYYQHWKSHETGRKKWKCDHCDFASTHERPLWKHSYRMHDQTACSKCGKSFTDIAAFDAHCLTHLDPIQCQYCTAVFYCKENVRTHEKDFCRIKQKESRDMVVCQKCGKSVAKPAMLRHLKSVHSSVSSCPYCGKNVKGLAKHYKITQCNIPEDQRNIQTVQCPICFKMIRKPDLKIHVKRAHDETDKTFSCEHCDYKTNMKANLYIHVKRVHERKPLKETCPICNQQCMRLEWHLQTYHTSVS